MVLRSTGGAADHQPTCLGVYRLIDSLNDRPVYKQEGGENYLYYNEAKSSWMVGTNIGDSYAWIKHSDRSSGSSSSSSSSSRQAHRHKFALFFCKKIIDCVALTFFVASDDP